MYWVGGCRKRLPLVKMSGVEGEVKDKSRKQGREGEEVVEACDVDGEGMRTEERWMKMGKEKQKKEEERKKRSKRERRRVVMSEKESKIRTTRLLLCGVLVVGRDGGGGRGRGGSSVGRERRGASRMGLRRTGAGGCVRWAIGKSGQCACGARGGGGPGGRAWF